VEMWQAAGGVALAVTLNLRLAFLSFEIQCAFGDAGFMGNTPVMKTRSTTLEFSITPFALRQA
jgi:hypothetical protein